MRRTLVGLIAALALGSVSPAAFAADMVPEPAPVMSWTGFYLGAGGGVGWADLDVNHRRCRLAHGDHHGELVDIVDNGKVCSEDEHDIEDFEFRRDFNESGDGNIIGIVQGGFDWELAPQFVVGVGADLTFGDVLGVDRNNHDDYHRLRFSFSERRQRHSRRLWPRWFRADRRHLPGLWLGGLELARCRYQLQDQA